MSTNCVADGSSAPAAPSAPTASSAPIAPSAPVAQPRKRGSPKGSIKDLSARYAGIFHGKSFGDGKKPNALYKRRLTCTQPGDITYGLIAEEIEAVLKLEFTNRGFAIFVKFANHDDELGINATPKIEFFDLEDFKNGPEKLVEFLKNLPVREKAKYLKNERSREFFTRIFDIVKNK